MRGVQEAREWVAGASADGSIMGCFNKFVSYYTSLGVFFLYCSMCIASRSSIKEINRLRRFPEVMHAMPKNCKKDSSHEKKMV